MIRNIKMGKEIAVVAENKIGILSSVAKKLAERGINITAISAQGPGGVALMNLVVDEHLRATDLLRKSGFAFRISNVLLLEAEDRPGVLLAITRKLASAKIDILNIYGSAPASYGPCILVLSTSNNQKAIVQLKRLKQS